MVFYVIIGALAAFGLVCALWAALGWLLPGSTGAALVCLALPGEAEEAVARRYRWLRELGFFSGPLLLVRQDAQAQPPYPGMEFCEPEELLSRLELERKKLDGTGT